MKDQTLFNRVARHLLKQGRRSVARIDGETHCRYRGDNGLKCAIWVFDTRRPVFGTPGGRYCGRQ